MLSTLNNNNKRTIWKHAMWCNIPLVANGFDQLKLPDEIPADVKIRIRVSRNFRTYSATQVIRNVEMIVPGTTYFVASVPVIHNGITYNIIGENFVATSNSFTGGGTVTTSAPKNNFNPMYEFGTGEFAPIQYHSATAKDAMKMINVVPNPYYAYSGYENSQLDNRIKVVNLPSKCTISIFTQSGTLVRKIERDVMVDNSPGTVVNPSTVNTETSIDWDLKNQKGIPVASGMYLIHVDAGYLGQRTLKWFGMLRPVDLDTF
jgi:hypothetical protein